MIAYKTQNTFSHFLINSKMNEAQKIVYLQIKKKVLFVLKNLVIDAKIFLSATCGIRSFAKIFATWRA